MIRLKDIFLFKDLDEKSLKDIEKFSHFKSLKKDEVIFYEGDEPKYLNILLNGIAKVYKIDKNGNEFIIHRFKGVSLIAELATIEKFNYPANCRMDSDGEILQIEFDEFEKFLKEDEICFKVMKSLLKKMKYLDSIIQTTLILDTETKIAKFIYENEDIFNKLKQKEIADILNIKPETLSRKLKKFKDLGIVENSNSKLLVKDKELIKEYFNW